MIRFSIFNLPGTYNDRLFFFQFNQFLSYRRKSIENKRIIKVIFFSIFHSNKYVLLSFSIFIDKEKLLINQIKKNANSSLDFKIIE